MQLLDSRLQTALQAQVTAEAQNARAYLGLCYSLEALRLFGLAAFMERSAAEELEHSRKFALFLNDRSTLTTQADALTACVAPSTAVEIFSAAAQLEAENTARIWDLRELAEEIEDSDAEVFLHWFIAEQRLSEAELDDYVIQLRAAGDNYAALLALDERIGEVKK